MKTTRNVTFHWVLWQTADCHIGGKTICFDTQLLANWPSNVECASLVARYCYYNSVHLSVYLSHQYDPCLVRYIKIVSAPHDRVMILVFWGQISQSRFQGFTSNDVVRGSALSKVIIWPIHPIITRKQCVIGISVRYDIS